MIEVIYSTIKRRIYIEDEILFKYGLNALLRYVSVMLIVLIISKVMDTLIETLFYTMAFIQLKCNVGGFHFKRKINCFIVSVLGLLCFPVLFSKERIDFGCAIMINIFCYLIIIKVAPIPSESKFLSKDDLIYFKNKIKIKLLNILLIQFIVFLFDLSIYYAVTSALLCITLDLLLFKLILFFRINPENELDFTKGKGR